MTFNLLTISTSQTTRATETRGRRSLLSWRQLIVVVVSLSASLGVLSRGQCDENDVAAPAADRQFVLTEQQFDKMVFGGGQQGQVVFVNGVRQVQFSSQPNNETALRKRLEVTIAAEIQAVDERVSLTDAQKKKLRLAGRGDVVQLASRVAELRLKLTSKSLDRQQFQELILELNPLRMMQQPGFLADDSLFQKTLRHTLTTEQFTRYRNLERERQATMVNNVLITLADIEWSPKAEMDKLTPENRQANRQRFVDELLTHGKLPRTQNTYFRYIVLLEIGRLEDRLKPLVIEESWKKLQTKVTEARQLEPTLRKSKLWPVAHADDDEVTDEKMED